MPYNKNETEFHDNPPLFNGLDRKHYFYVDANFRDTVLKEVRTNTNRVMLVVAYGYFKACKQFFDVANQADIDYVAQKFGLDSVSMRWEDYKTDSKLRHRKEILSAFGIKSYSEDHIPKIREEIRLDARSRRGEWVCFKKTVGLLLENRIEVPNYNTLMNLIKEIYRQHESDLVSTIENTLSQEARVVLDQLFETAKGRDDAWKVHRLTLIKKFPHSPRPAKIRENLSAYDTLKPLFELVYPLYQILELTEEGLKRYSNSVVRTQMFQIKRRSEPSRYLHLIAFIVHRFYELQDLLVDLLQSMMTTFFNKARLQAKEVLYDQRKEQSNRLKNLMDVHIDIESLFSEFVRTLQDPNLDNDGKIEILLKLVQKRSSKSLNDDEIKAVEGDIEKLSGDSLFMSFLEDMSNTIIKRANGILLRLEFDTDSNDVKLLKAIARFQEKDGNIDSFSTVGFLKTNEVKYIDTKEVFKKSLYKVFLFHHVMHQLKCESLNLLYSYRYRTVEKLLISKDRFQRERDHLLKITGLKHLDNIHHLFDKLQPELTTQFAQTNQHYLSNQNDYLQPDGMGGCKLVSQRNTRHQLISMEEKSVQLFPEDQYFPISEVLHTVHAATGCLNEFEHQSFDYLKERPENRNFIAGIMGLGLHLGTQRMTKLAREIKLSSLESTTSAYFTTETATRVSDAITRYIEKMPLSNRFKTDYGVQTSSDGLKYTVYPDTVSAGRSFKYGGKDMVIAPYVFIDSRGIFPYSKVISGSRKEAHFVVDGLMHNEVVKSDMHSTDTHGYTEAVFGLTYLLGYSFAPRIKNVHKSTLYAFEKRGHYSRQKYPILPTHTVDQDLIVRQWDNILRVLVSLKLGDVTASQIFQRLNSYVENENPLYRAIKAFGGIPKSIFILKYMDDPDLRQAIHKQLNKGESGNRLDRALAIGTTSYTQELREDQELVECCKRIIKNSIVCWNYMYLTQKLQKTKDPVARQKLLDKIEGSLIFSWNHFLIHGTFDFSDRTLRDSLEFDYDRMINPKALDF